LVNNMTSNTWLSLLPQIATWVTVVLILLTFLEMVRQRRTTYRPELVVSGLTVYGYLDNFLKPAIWLDEDVDSLDPHGGILGHRPLKLLIHNLGLGAAREVQLSWEVDLKKLIEDIESLQGASGDTTEVSLNQQGHVVIEFEDRGFISINPENDLNHSLDFVLPASVDKSGTSVQFPITYVDLMSLKLSQEFHIFMQGPGSPISGFSFEPLTLRLRYKDIAGRKHSKNLLFEPSLIGIRLDPFEPGAHVFTARLEPAE